jgi:hypothetical protein
MPSGGGTFGPQMLAAVILRPGGKPTAPQLITAVGQNTLSRITQFRNLLARLNLTETAELLRYALLQKRATSEAAQITFSRYQNAGYFGSRRRQGAHQSHVPSCTSCNPHRRTPWKRPFPATFRATKSGFPGRPAYYRIEPIMEPGNHSPGFNWSRDPAPVGR